jgi:hypothetical protein
MPLICGDAPPDETGLRQPVEPLPHRRRRDAEGFRKIADAHRIPHPQKLDEGVVGGTLRVGVNGRIHNSSVEPIGFLTSRHVKKVACPDG